MMLTETHHINKGNSLYDTFDDLCFKAKNLYNAALYKFRQSYFDETTKTLGWMEINTLFSQSRQEDFVSLQSKVANGVIKMLGANISSFWGLLKLKKEGKYNKKVKLPKYLHKTEGRFVLDFRSGTVSKKRGKKGEIILCPRSYNIKIPTKIKEKIKCVRVVPRRNYYKIEVIYEFKEALPKNEGCIAGIDPGSKNLLAIAFSDKEKRPLIISGKKIKSINCYFNKLIGEAQSKLRPKTYKSSRLDRLWTKRENKLSYEMHVISNFVTNLLDESGCCKVVIGDNKEQKQEIKLGRKNNRKFVQIPHQKLFRMIEYKCKKKGIEVIMREESYTSKASFIDNDFIPKFDPENKKEYEFSGKRLKRGIYKTSNGKKINADINGAYNIMAKQFPEELSDRNGRKYSPIILKL
jgi:transposase, IS605 OrfB family, central region